MWEWLDQHTRQTPPPYFSTALFESSTQTSSFDLLCWLEDHILSFQMATSVRARRPPSPPPPLNPPYAPVQHTQRFPHPRQDHLDADERRALASKNYLSGRKQYPPGGLNITLGEWKLLVVVLVVACAVRMFRLSKPTSVV